MYSSQSSQPLPSGSPAADQPPHGGRPDGSRLDKALNSRGLLPIDGEVITVEHVVVCISPDSPVLMVASRDTSEGRVFYTVNVLEAYLPRKSGPPTTSVSCIYSNVTGLVRDTGQAMPKVPQRQILRTGSEQAHGVKEIHLTKAEFVDNTKQGVDMNVI